MIKQKILNNIKNVYGWKTKRKIVVISVDDYGNVRLNSKKAREEMDKAGMKILSPFDAYDSLETRLDLEMLFDTLTSVKDINGRHAIFTPFVVTSNIDFESMQKSGNEEYILEMLPETFSKLSVEQKNHYEGTWKLWQEGVSLGIFKPQFHGREHLNLKVFEEKLRNQDFEVLTALKNKSYSSISSSGYESISYTAAFEFDKIEENEKFIGVIQDGLNQFKRIFGVEAVHFNPPGGREHPIIHSVLNKNGIKYLDTPFVKKQHNGSNRYERIVNYTGKINKEGMLYMVRNVVFEPTHKIDIDWVNHAFTQIEAAFRWNRPAIISSHRFNYCGHIDSDNRELGLSELSKLLKRIVDKWPNVEFMSADELGSLISQGQ